METRLTPVRWTRLESPVQNCRRTIVYENFHELDIDLLTITRSPWKTHLTTVRSTVARDSLWLLKKTRSKTPSTIVCENFLELEVRVLYLYGGRGIACSILLIMTPKLLRRCVKHFIIVSDSALLNNWTCLKFVNPNNQCRLVFM